MSSTIPPTIATLVSDNAVAQSGDSKQLVQAALDNPQVLQAMQQVLGPYLRQIGHSALPGALGGLVVGLGARWGLEISPDLAQLMGVGAFIAASYAWQAGSIWWGKRRK